jgi:purine-binding chemotaxis protein CheW
MSERKIHAAATALVSASKPLEILKARARALAKPPAQSKDLEQTLEVVEFGLAKETYAVEHAFVREVLRLEDLTPLPCTPPFIRGVISVRGQILPVIDIKKFFDLPDEGITDLHRVLVVHGEGIELGILADTVASVRSIEVARVQPALPTLTGVRAAYLKGVSDDRIVILDVSKILSDPKLIVNQETGTEVI